ncbi:MAG: NADH-quinone oxidoreductase subunit L [Planctomycetes bacterium]|nr:NADH-quinone oxidoreductase subunit L [Planctomycetota bacterium]
MRTLLILIPALPLAAALLTGLLGKRVLREKSHWPTILAIGVSFLLSLLLCVDVWDHSNEAGSAGYEYVETLWSWMEIDDAYQLDGGDSVNFAIDVTLRADSLTSVMLVMVTFISMLVAIYSAGYMKSDPGYSRFFALIALFVFSMTMLVSVSNFVLLYVFWEAVGACSYLLIGFWFQKKSAAAAGMKAFLVNRVGDFGFALALFFIWIVYGSLDFHGLSGVFGNARLSNSNGYVGGGTGLTICLLLMLGACGKSAQFPLHVWLPDAMEGPSPVSALIHAATMVTAGVYMIARCTPLFAASMADPYMLGEGAQAIAIHGPLVVATIGVFTALLAGLIALTQNDLKRVLAYSTISQLGYMFLALGTGSVLGIVAGMFHLFTHAFFKALLFLGSGSVMHAMGHVIDMTKFGGLRKLMPWTHWTFLIGCLALAGVVPFAGFFSKDAILVEVFLAGEADGATGQWYTMLYWSAIVTAALTAFYTFRAYFMTFFGPLRMPHEAGNHAHESPGIMTGPLAILAVFATVVGFVGFMLLDDFEEFLRKTPSLAYLSESASHAEVHSQVAILSTLLALSGIGLAAFLYLGNRREVQWLAGLSGLRWLYKISYGKFFFDQIYMLLVIWPTRFLAWLCFLLDRWLVDGLVNLCAAAALRLGAILRTLQTGALPFYAFLMMLMLLVLLISAFWTNLF